jgi:putative membrane protein
MARIFTLIFLAVILLVGISFSILNSQVAHLNYYFGSWDLPLSMALMLTLGAGALLGLLGSVGVIIRLKREISKLKKNMKHVERRLTHTRSATKES